MIILSYKFKIDAFKNLPYKVDRFDKINWTNADNTTVWPSKLVVVIMNGHFHEKNDLFPPISFTKQFDTCSFESLKSAYLAFVSTRTVEELRGEIQ